VYFPEDAQGSYDGYVIPDYSLADDLSVDPKQRECDFLYHSLNAAPLMVTMLVDPRGPVHATTGILPTKSIAIPRHHYEGAMRRIQMSFLAAPLLVDSAGADAALPLADVPGRSWRFVERDGEMFTSRPLRPAPLQLPFAGPTVIREGWLRLMPDEEREPS